MMTWSTASTRNKRRLPRLAGRGGRGLHYCARRRDLARLASRGAGYPPPASVCWRALSFCSARFSTAVPISLLQLAIGIMLLLFGIGWLRKASLRAAGVIPLHDEEAIFAAEAAELSEEARGRQRNLGWAAGITALKAVLLEGLEVVFIVIAVGAGRGLLVPAGLGALAACAVVLAAGAIIHRPLSRVPENTLKIRRWRHAVRLRRVLDRRRARHRMARRGFGAAVVRCPVPRCGPPRLYFRRKLAVEFA